MADRKDFIGFTLDPTKLGNVLAQDPTAMRELIQGIQESQTAPLPLTTALGAANLTPGEGQEPTWCSVFPATVQGKASGEEGLFYRNNTRKGKGDRIQMRLRRQPKRTEAVHAATSPGVVLPPGIDLNNPQVVAVLQAISAQAPVTAPAPAASVELPADVAALVKL